MAKLTGYPVVGDISVTTTEKIIDIEDCFKLILNPQGECSISINDNNHYKIYPKGIVLPIELNNLSSKPITKLYVKSSAACTLGIWGFK